MFAKLKQGAASAAAAAAEQAQKTASDIKARVDTGVAGKKLLDEGGEGIKVKLLAMKASRDAVTSDGTWAMKQNKLITDYSSAAEKMQAAAGVTSDDQQALGDLGKEYAQRSARLAQLTTGGDVPQAASLDPVESDALSILIAKTGVQDIHQKARSSFSAATAPKEDSGEPTAEKKSLIEQAKEKAKQAQDRAKERVGNAQAGKKMVDEGGENMKVILLGKKASLDTTDADNKNIDLLWKTVELYKAAEAKLQEAMSAEGVPLEGTSPSFSSLASSHAARRAKLEALLSDVVPAPAAINAHESETDGILYLTTQMKINDATKSASEAVVDAQGRIVEQSMSSAVSSATGGAVTSVPEGTGKAAVQYAKENPEQAKAAMKLAADAGAGKGGYTNS